MRLRAFSVEQLSQLFRSHGERAVSLNNWDNCSTICRCGVAQWEGKSNPAVLGLEFPIVIDRIAIAGYRSIRSLILRLGQLNVITGANGSGKSNLYRALRMMADAADGRLTHSLAREDGLDSVLWAGPEQISSAMVSCEVAFQIGGTAMLSGDI